jgi:hypothetical protein
MGSRGGRNLAACEQIAHDAMVQVRDEKAIRFFAAMPFQTTGFVPIFRV